MADVGGNIGFILFDHSRCRVRASSTVFTSNRVDKLLKERVIRVLVFVGISPANIWVRVLVRSHPPVAGKGLIVGDISGIMVSTCADARMVTGGIRHHERN